MLGRRDCICQEGIKNLIPKAGQRHADMSQESDQNLEAMLSSLQEISETSLESSDFLIGKWDG